MSDNKETVLIIGITGFLGRNLTKKIWYDSKYNIIGTGYSPNKILHLNHLIQSWGATHNDIPIHMIDIVSDIHKLENILKHTNIDYIIHCAALKYLDISTKNPEKAINININGTLNILKLSEKYNIKNLIGISTDKANKPINTYGMTKYLMEELIKKYKYSIYQGVNFFWSDGSVLDVWRRQMMKNKDLCVTNFEQQRHYCNVDDVCNDIIDNLNIQNKYIIPKNIYKIKLLDLFNAFVKYFNYDIKKCFIIGSRTNEKIIEDILVNEKCKSLEQEDILKILDNTAKNIELSF